MSERSQPVWTIKPRILLMPPPPRKSCFICGIWEQDARIKTIGWCRPHADIRHRDNECVDFTLSPFGAGT